MAKFCNQPSRGSSKSMGGKPAPVTEKRQSLVSKKLPYPVTKPTKGR